MTAGKYCNREVVITEADTMVGEAARLMRAHHVGDLVVVEKQGETNRPVGIVTDRDLVIEVLAQEVPLDSVTLKDVMSVDPVEVTEDETLIDTLELMRNKGVRRVLVVDSQGGLQGILSADDAIELITESMNNLVKLVGRELAQEKQRHP
jgi:CBS domain-containing protein